MIGNLLKQLFPALGRFVWYHTTRVFRPRKMPEAPTAVIAPAGSMTPRPTATATEASIGALSDDAGLGPEYERAVRWPFYRANVPSQEVASDGLYKLWTAIPGGHKWTHYFPIYQAIFGPLRSEPLRILEIGIWHGASLKLWRQYFEHPKTILVGVDILPECMKFDAPAAGVHVRIGSQTDHVFLQRVVKEFGPFDLIIDDGSHHSAHIIASFNYLFSKGLKDSGTYFVEDLHANYWHPWRDSKKSFLDVCKELLEHMHAHYKSAPPAAFLIDKPSDQPSADLKVPLITTMIREIRFFDSIVVIYKTRRRYVPYYLRTAE
jgi:hypothetical protein